VDKHLARAATAPALLVVDLWTLIASVVSRDIRFLQVANVFVCQVHYHQQQGVILAISAVLLAVAPKINALLADRMLL
jgi:hypothetical protein